jgi:hypothetical protein
VTRGQIASSVDELAGRNIDGEALEASCVRAELRAEIKTAFAIGVETDRLERETFANDLDQREGIRVLRILNEIVAQRLPPVISWGGWAAKRGPSSELRRRRPRRHLLGR